MTIITMNGGFKSGLTIYFANGKKKHFSRDDWYSVCTDEGYLSVLNSDALPVCEVAMNKILVIVKHAREP